MDLEHFTAAARVPVPIHAPVASVPTLPIVVVRVAVAPGRLNVIVHEVSRIRLSVTRSDLDAQHVDPPHRRLRTIVPDPTDGQASRHLVIV